MVCAPAPLSNEPEERPDGVDAMAMVSVSSARMVMAAVSISSAGMMGRGGVGSLTGAGAAQPPSRFTLATPKSSTLTV